MYDHTEYEEIRDDYLSLVDNDFPSAYRLMVASSNLLETYESYIAEASKEVNSLKSVAEAVEAKISVYHMDGNPIGKSEKMAKYDARTVEAKDNFYEAKQVADDLQVRANFLQRIYFDCKSVWEKGNRGYRENRA